MKGTGWIYLHCDPAVNSYLRILMDAVCKASNFRNEIVWRIGWVSGLKTTTRRGWIRNHDTILCYPRESGSRQAARDFLHVTRAEKAALGGYVTPIPFTNHNAKAEISKAPF